MTAADAAAFGGDYDVYVMSPTTGAKTKLLGEAGAADVDAVGVYARFVRPVFRSTFDEPNGHVIIYEGKPEAEVTVLDMRVLSSLVFQNTPTGRLVDPELASVFIYEDMPPPLEVDSFDKGGANVATDAFGRVYVKRRLLGGVPLESDGSTKFTIPGGLPIVLKLPDTKLSREKELPRVPARVDDVLARASTRTSRSRPSSSARCAASATASISGRAVDAALKPDFVTQASSTHQPRQAPVRPEQAPGRARRHRRPPATP